MVHDVLQGELRVHFLRTAQMGHDDNGTSACKNLLKGGHGPTDTGVVRNLEVFVQGDVEIYAHDGFFAGKIVAVNKLLHN